MKLNDAQAKAWRQALQMTLLAEANLETIALAIRDALGLDGAKIWRFSVDGDAVTVTEENA